MKKLKACATCGAKLRRSKKPKKNLWGWGSSADGATRIFCPVCRQYGPDAENLEAAIYAWNKQQRQAKPREWKDEITKTISFLYRTIGRQMWLDFLEDKDIIEIRDMIMTAFEKHLQLRKLVAQPETELSKVLADNLKQEITNGQLRTENQQLRQRIQQLEIEKKHPLKDHCLFFWRV